MLPHHHAMQTAGRDLPEDKAWIAACLRVAMIRRAGEAKALAAQAMPNIPVQHAQTEISAMVNRGIGSPVKRAAVCDILGIGDPAVDRSPCSPIAWDETDQSIVGTCAIRSDVVVRLMRLVADADARLLCRIDEEIGG